MIPTTSHVLSTACWLVGELHTLSPTEMHDRRRTVTVNVQVLLGRATAQVVSRRPLTAEDRVSPCGICGGQSGTGAGFSQSSSGFPRQYIILPSLSKLISSGECVKC
jgi:hypothetical protein